ncbi:hypothetical protein UPYG_G00184770 [Umbra pygmaea]|uniref:GINS complex subunit 4 n=1 Tax=Umbra pygmaea TaxID=75934 RepID=A0ABD0WRG0_UMBPY
MVFVCEEEQDPGERSAMEEGRCVEVTLNQKSAGMDISDSASECEERPRSSPVEERAFISHLHCYMKDRGTPIERIPHLGFKQINLWKIYKAVEKLGGYDSVTARRLWKNVYDELGGSPGSTSAATCTRRHYERLVLPFERQLRGEEDKPLPPSKPRKQYKRSSEGKGSSSEGSRSEGKRKRPHVEKETVSEGQVHSTSSSPWTTPSERLNPDGPTPSNENTASDDLSFSTSSTTQPAQGLTSSSWRVGHIQSTTNADIISPLEKKKRMAQASLSQASESPRPEDCKGRPSVIHCSEPSGLPPPSRPRPTSEGSPHPLSSSSSRSPSPYSISSEDCQALTEDRAPVPKPEEPLRFSINSTSSRNGVHKPQSCSPDVKEYVGLNAGQRDFHLVSPRPGDTVCVKGQNKDFVWSPVCSGSRRQAHQIPAPISYTYSVKSCSSPATSSFTKVYPKSVEPYRPIPLQPCYTFHQTPNRPMLHDDALVYTKKLPMVPEQTEKKEKSRTMLPKPFPTQQPLFPSNAGIPVSYFIPACDKTRGESGQKPTVHPIYLPTQIRLPQSQSHPMYRYASVGPNYSSPRSQGLTLWRAIMLDSLSDDGSNMSGVDDGQEDVLTPAELIGKLEEAWLNEKFSPELLENKSEIVECVLEQLTHMDDNLQRVRKGDVKASVHRMEIDRIRYVLSSYLRSRLKKIEKFFPHVLEKEKLRLEGDPSFLSPEEFAFAKEYLANTETYLKSVALKHMPPNLQTVDMLKAVPQPCLDSFVFLRVRERQENILVEPETDEQREYVWSCTAYLRCS